MQIVLGPRAHPACAQIIRLDTSSACQFSLCCPSGGAAGGVVSVLGRRAARVRGRLIAHTWSPKSALRRETPPTMGDRRMVFGDGLEDIKVDGKTRRKRYQLNSGLFSRISVIQRWRWAGWIFHSAGHRRICSPALALWPHHRPHCRLLQVRHLVLCFQASPKFLFVLLSLSSFCSQVCRSFNCRSLFPPGWC